MVIINLIVCGSSSDGNTYLLDSESNCMILDCGVNPTIVKKYLGYRISHIKFAVCTHVHSDHSKYIDKYLNMGIKVFMPEQVKEKYQDNGLAIPVMAMQGFMVDGFSVIPFEVPHDEGVTCFAYLISGESFGKLLYMTDCIYCKYNLSKQGINHFLVECHHSDDLLEEYESSALRDRVLQSHMDLQTCKEFIRLNKTPNLRNVILCHLGHNSGAGDYFVSEIRKVTGDHIPVMIAEPGLTVELMKEPF